MAARTHFPVAAGLRINAAALRADMKSAPTFESVAGTIGQVPCTLKQADALCAPLRRGEPIVPRRKLGPGLGRPYRPPLHGNLVAGP